MNTARLPAPYQPHGGGPSFFTAGERQRRHQGSEDFLRGVHRLLPLMIASGAGSDAPARRLWRGAVGPTCLGAWAFD